MSTREPFVTYLELRESTADGDVGAGLSHTSKGLVLLHVLELAADGEYERFPLPYCSRCTAAPALQ